MKPPAALILDRDGTLIEHVPYLCDPAEVRLLPGVAGALVKARAAGARLFLHSNQSGVGRGFFDIADVHACNKRMIELLSMGPAPFERICIAAEDPEEPSVYRKPSPAFAQEIISEFGYDPTNVCYIGDRGNDLATAHVAGTRGAGVATGLEDLQEEVRELGIEGIFPIFNSLSEAIGYLFPRS